MAYLNATASDAFDLLERLRAFVTSDASLVAAGKQWQQLDVGRSGAVIGNDSTATDAGLRVSGSYLNGLGACTIAGFMRFDPYHDQEPGNASNRQGMLFCSGDSNGRSGVRVYVHGDGRVRFGIYPTSNATPYHEVSSGILANNTWYHVAARYDGGEMTLFVNGTPVASIAGAAWPASHTYAYLMSRALVGTQNLRGRITSWGVWNQALTDADIADLAANEDPRTIGVGGPNQYWPLCQMNGVSIENMVEGGVQGVMDNTSSNGWLQSGVGKGLPTSYIFKAPGLSGTEEIFLHFRLEYFPETLNYLLCVKSSLAYDAGAFHYDQPSSPPNTVYLPIWNDAMPFWAVANGQRLGLVVKVSASYQSGYLGKIFPYGTPAQYPYPVLCAGMSIGKSKWSDAVSENSFFALPEYNTNSSSFVVSSSAYLRTPYGRWNGLFHSSSNLINGVRCHPYYSYGDTTGGPRYGRTVDNDYVLLPIVLHSNYASQSGMYGEVDGFYWVSGEGNASENIVTVGGVQHLVFQNNVFTSNNDYMAMRLE